MARNSASLGACLEHLGSSDHGVGSTPKRGWLYFTPPSRKATLFTAVSRFLARSTYFPDTPCPTSFHSSLTPVTNRLALCPLRNFSVFFRFLPYSGQEWGETIPPMSAQQPLGLASQSSTDHPMTTCLPLSLSRILRIACCVIGAMAAILMALPVVAQQPAFLTNGLVAYYPFNGNANDKSENGKDGVIIGAPTLSADRFGRTSSSYRFALGANRIFLKNVSVSLMEGAKNSVSFWMRWDGEFYAPNDPGCFSVS